MKKVGKLDPKCRVKTLQGGGGSVMVWGFITFNGVGPLIRLEARVDAASYAKMLQERVFPWFRANFEDGFIFQQDNASVHTGRIVKEFFSSQGNELLSWSPQSPDLSPIENL